MVLERMTNQVMPDILHLQVARAILRLLSILVSGLAYY